MGNNISLLSLTMRSGRGGRGCGPGSGRAPGDDSITSNHPSREPGLFSIGELTSVAAAPCSMKDMIIRTNGYEIDSSRAKIAYQYDIRWKGTTNRGTEFDLNKQTKDDVKFQQKQIALQSVFYKLLRASPEFFKINDGEEKYVYDSGSMFFSQNKILNDQETKQFEIDVEHFDQVAKDFYRNVTKATAEIKLTREINPDNLNGDLENDRPALQYLEFAFSQHQRNSGDFLSFGNRFYEKKSGEPIEQTPLLLKDGVSRSIRIIVEPSAKRDDKVLKPNPVSNAAIASGIQGGTGGFGSTQDVNSNLGDLGYGARSQQPITQDEDHCKVKWCCFRKKTKKVPQQN